MAESSKASATLSSRKKRGVIAGDTPTLIVVRHGDTALNSGHNSPEKFRSHLDVPLSPEGRQEAKDVAKLIASKYDVTCVYCSDLSRAEHTGSEIADATGAELEPDERLRPWDLGTLSGKPANEEAFKLLNEYARKGNVPVPGGESFNDFREKYLTALDEIFEETCKEDATNVLVTHTRDVQLTKASHATDGGFGDHNIDLKEFENYENELHTGELMVIEYNKGEWRIKETPHAPE